MKGTFLKTVLGSALSCLVASCFLAGTAFGLDLSLVAEEATVTMPDTTVVTMWGLRDTADPGHAAGEWKIPVFTTTDTVLNIDLTNALPADTPELAKPTSLMIPGLRAIEAGAMVPTWTDGSTGNRFADPNDPQPAELQKRVRSLTHETPNGGGPVTYSWDLKPGTYLIQSGTHQALQVQMGLFAVLVVNAAADQAYGLETTFTQEQVLVYSEIDAALHAAVAGNNYGPGLAYSSTMNFHPNYYLINGQPYGAGSVPVQAGTSLDDIMLRFVNAGYETRVPVLQGDYFSLVAEDGNLLPYARELYSIELPAGKTKDVLWSTPASGVFNIYDGRFHLTNDNVSGGGLLVKMQVGTPTLGVISPTGGDTLEAYSSVLVSWSPPAGAATYLVRFSPDGGANWARIAQGVTQTQTLWTVPNVLTTQGVIRVTAYDGGGAWLGAASSDGFFEIVAATPLAVTNPNGGTLTANTVENLTWTAPATAASFLIRASFDGGATWTRVAQNVTTTEYLWSVPNTLTTQGVIRVTAYDSGGGWLGADSSDAFFSIVAPATPLAVTYPNTGETLGIGTSQNLTWTAPANANSFRIRVSVDGGTTWGLIASGVTATEYLWTVPNIPTTQGVIRVTAYDISGNWLGVDSSDVPFIIE